jgi:SAM-dependent methyltransferase
MQQGLRKIEKTYDAVAREYAVAFADELDKKPKDQEMLRRFRQELGTRKPAWDFGCGPGHIANYLNQLGLEIAGLDLSEKILAQARTRYPSILFRKGNILALDVASNTLAGVVSFYAMAHFTKKQVLLAFREILRTLQPEGLFLFTFHIGDNTIHLEHFLGNKIDVDFTFFSTDFMLNGLRESGFTRIEAIEREPYPGVEYQSRRAYVFARKPGA